MEENQPVQSLQLFIALNISSHHLCYFYLNDIFKF